jgi:hypothetical protein
MGKHLFGLLTAACLLFALAAPADAQVFINEIMANPPGSDNGFEFIELRSTTPSLSLSGLHLLIIEGDGANAGIIDQALNLGALSTGTNGLFLWRDSSTVLVPPPSPATFVHVADFVPDIENGAQTYLIVQSFTGSVGDDLDTNNDGILDSTPWAAVIDAIGVRESGTGGTVYGAHLGFADFPNTLLFTPDLIFRVSGTNAWVGADVNGTSPGPYDFDPAELVDIFGNPLSLSEFDITTATPGSANPVPEPSLVAIVAVGMTGAVYRQWRRRRSRAPKQARK